MPPPSSCASRVSRRPTRRRRASRPKASSSSRSPPTARPAALVEVNCETDFVAREQDFRGFAQAVARPRSARAPASLEALLCCEAPGRRDRRRARRALIAKIGENIGVRRVALLSAPTHLGAYVHGTASARSWRIEGGEPPWRTTSPCTSRPATRAIISGGCVPADSGGQGARDLTEQAQIEAANTARPSRRRSSRRWWKGGCASRSARSRCSGQPFVKDPDITIEKLLKSGKAKVTAFERFEVGAGIEKKQEDFVAEVMAQVKAQTKSADDVTIGYNENPLQRVFLCRGAGMSDTVGAILSDPGEALGRGVAGRGRLRHRSRRDPPRRLRNRRKSPGSASRSPSSSAAATFSAARGSRVPAWTASPPITWACSPRS